jgi:hypothetical protein
LRSWALKALGAYSLALAAGSAAEAVRRGRGDALALPLVLATMHLSWGAGFLCGCARFGPPLSALSQLARR